MCLILERQKVKVMEEDTITYKVLSLDLDAIFYCFAYEIGVVYNIVMKESNDFTVADQIVGKALIDKYGYDDETQGYKTDQLMAIGEGFHSCKTLARAKLIRGVSCRYTNIYMCVIPKGSEYYEDITGLLVSNSIIVKELINTDE